MRYAAVSERERDKLLENIFRFATTLYPHLTIKQIEKYVLKESFKNLRKKSHTELKQIYEQLLVKGRVS
ncbi:hypothetical protein [Persephonella sp.]